MRRKVLIAMSGGVDSSVAAYLLRERGFECVGATMRLYTGESAGTGSRTCCTLDDAEDARDAARRLGIPHYVFNFADDFEKCVIRKFAEEYLAGFTPNPCIDCNRFIKFDRFLRRADELGIDYIATGHYARIVRCSDTGRLAVAGGVDISRDQSYVLAFMTQEELSRTLFPLGELTKTEVREIARRMHFHNASKPDSQDICFVPDGDYGDFLERYTGEKFRSGNVLSPDGTVIGKHAGAARYTLGQRRGLGVSAEKRLYVCDKSMADNTVTLGSEEDLYSSSLLAGDFAWGAIPPAPGPFRAAAKVRYRREAVPVTVYPPGCGSSDNAGANAAGPGVANAALRAVGNAASSAVGNADSSAVGNAASSAVGNVDSTAAKNAAAKALNSAASAVGNVDSTAAKNAAVAATAPNSAANGAATATAKAPNSAGPGVAPTDNAACRGITPTGETARDCLLPAGDIACRGITPTDNAACRDLTSVPGDDTSSGWIRIEFDRPERAVTPGQAVVLYRDDVVLAAGIIARVLKN